mmetsp:Transcript_28815/g.81185  ORF Transcript_28815/g.81185 Transcript_28815/m.81185 type:complete len:165 (+) Transcript_28815:69-563(+)|eukprot:CAMPEP_0117673878 /NCGR_PEP_ID=MMETSP0804-20121206/14724_1 /TAXON_ID=1074897 /ORGANISM="Tetraselmis astigmatica, Strain CCMP880" /LENGTH=164 /DNA_ID=CAMNT_0005482679 /DNA_START=1 /DNA_END=495 /DNA_ORIENTATION=-
MASDEELMTRLEEFFSGPEFTSAVGDFMSDNVPQLEFVDLTLEQPLKNHGIFTKYNEMVEILLADFLASQSTSAEEVYAACKRLQESGQTTAMVCLDYLLASTEYREFMQLAYDHSMLCSYNPDAVATQMWAPEEEQGEGDDEQQQRWDGLPDGVAVATNSVAL